MRKHYTPTLKAKVVLELLKDEKLMTQVASERGIHPTQLRDWKKQAVDGLPELFAESTEAARAATGSTPFHTQGDMGSVPVTGASLYRAHESTCFQALSCV